MAQDKQISNEKYQGSGRLVSALGKASLFSIPASLLNGFAGVRFINNLDDAGFNPTSVKEAMQIKDVKGRGLFIGTSVLAVTGLVYGLISGWRTSSRGKAQFEGMKSEAVANEAKIEGLQTQVSGLHQEVQGHRASFAERHAKKEHASHAEKAGGHHGEHGSHAEAARASQHEAENAQHAM